MEWRKGAVGLEVFKGDWEAAGHLRHMDPYLVWFDVTRFGGASLPGVVPIIEKRRTGKLRYKSNARTLKELSTLVASGFTATGAVERFEVAPGILTDEPGGPANNPPGVLDTPDPRQRGIKPVVGFIDYGCAFAHRKFRVSAAGTATRVLAIWNQGGAVFPPLLPVGLKTLQWRLPPDFFYGSETHRDDLWKSQPAGSALTLNDYIRQFDRGGVLDEEACYRYSGYAPVVDRRASHGTHIMDIATGWPNPLDSVPALAGMYEKGPPHDTDIVFVQLPRHIRGRQVAGLLRANVYDGLRYIEACAPEEADVVVNLSYGGYAGPHDGTSVVEEAIDHFLSTHRKSRSFELVIAAGNARDRQLHLKDVILPRHTATFYWNNLPDDPSDSFVEVWLPKQAEFSIRITTPGTGGATASEWLSPGSACTLVDGEPVGALVFVERACQSDVGTMVLLAVGPTRLAGHRRAAPYGQWTIEVRNEGGRQATIDAWCERDDPAFGSEGGPRQSYFTPEDKVDKNGTLSGLAHGHEPIVVGGYAVGGGVARYSGTGPGRGQQGRLRCAASAGRGSARRGPEELAPSDEGPSLPGLAAAGLIGTDTVRLSGTSVAAAALTRCILDGNFKRRPPPKRGQPSKPPPSYSPSNPGKDDMDSHPDQDLLPP